MTHHLQLLQTDGFLYVLWTTSWLPVFCSLSPKQYLHLLSHLLEVVKELQSCAETFRDETAAFAAATHESKIRKRRMITRPLQGTKGLMLRLQTRCCDKPTLPSLHFLVQEEWSPLNQNTSKVWWIHQKFPNITLNIKWSKLYVS